MLHQPIHRVAEIFSVLADPELRALWFADWISDVGNFVTFIALAVYVHALTGSSTAVGVRFGDVFAADERGTKASRPPSR